MNCSVYMDALSSSPLWLFQQVRNHKLIYDLDVEGRVILGTAVAR